MLPISFSSIHSRALFCERMRLQALYATLSCMLMAFSAYIGTLFNYKTRQSFNFKVNLPAGSFSLCAKTAFRFFSYVQFPFSLHLLTWKPLTQYEQIQPTVSVSRCKNKQNMVVDSVLAAHEYSKQTKNLKFTLI